MGRVDAIEAAGLEVAYPGADRPALTLDRLSVARGERVALVGPSGGGKTTLLRLLTGLIRPTRGRLVVGGRPAGEPDGRAGMIFQDFALVERATVLENVLYGRLGHVGTLGSLLGRFPGHDRAIAWAMVREVGLEEQVHRRVDRLSGGQRQRVAVARALAQEPALLLADEPVSNLDPSLTSEILDLLAQVQARHGLTLVTSLHQPRLAGRIADRVLGIRAGRVVFDGPPARLDPAALRTIYGRSFVIRSDDELDLAG